MTSKDTTQAVDEQGSAEQLLDLFLQDLERQEASAKTRPAHRLDLLHSASECGHTRGEFQS